MFSGFDAAGAEGGFTAEFWESGLPVVGEDKEEVVVVAGLVGGVVDGDVGAEVWLGFFGGVNGYFEAVVVVFFAELCGGL